MYGPSPWARRTFINGRVPPPTHIQKQDDGTVFVFGMSGGFSGVRRELRFSDIETYASYNKDKLFARDRADATVQTAVFRLLTNPHIRDSYNEDYGGSRDLLYYYMEIGRRRIGLGTTPRRTPLPDHLRSDVQTLREFMREVF